MYAFVWLFVPFVLIYCCWATLFLFSCGITEIVCVFMSGFRWKKVVVWICIVHQIQVPFHRFPGHHALWMLRRTVLRSPGRKAKTVPVLVHSLGKYILYIYGFFSSKHGTKEQKSKTNEAESYQNNSKFRLCEFTKSKHISFDYFFTTYIQMPRKSFIC